MSHAGFRSIANNGPAEFYFIGLAIYYCAFIGDQKRTMAVTAALIVIDFLLHHRGGTVSPTQYYVPSSKSTWDPLNPDDPYNDCSD